eukprot:scaffold54322_cov74-Phaeocystis_antarctica.AAC.1
MCAKAPVLCNTFLAWCQRVSFALSTAATRVLCDLPEGAEKATSGRADGVGDCGNIRLRSELTSTGVLVAPASISLARGRGRCCEMTPATARAK